MTSQFLRPDTLEAYPTLAQRVHGDQLTMLGTIARSIRNLLTGTAPPRNQEPGTSPERVSDALGTPERRVDCQYCALLASDDPVHADETELAAAWRLLEGQMALVPAGDTTLRAASVAAFHDREAACEQQHMRIGAIYLDRYAVTNEDYARFVASGAYRQPECWPTPILPHLLHFTDQTGTPGPRFWSHGRPPRDKLKHPVTGVNWYEANAYARWAGKRLPTPAEWQRAGCWSDSGGEEKRFPWGNAFDPGRANTWLGGPGGTVPVDEYYVGCAPNGVYQLVGNTWEWVAAAFECICDEKNSRVVLAQPMGEIRGGAFDTYFENQCTCQFRSGQPLLYRGINVGFRCCVSADQLRATSRPIVFA
jgi:iron(II)-dependent oxidoreductase